MEKRVYGELADNLFWQELHRFQTERAAGILEHMVETFGEGVTEIVQNMETDWREPLRLYIGTTVRMIEKLKAQYGDEVLQVLKAYNEAESLARGRAISSPPNSALEDVIRIFSQCGQIESRSATEAVIRRPGCLVSEVSRELGVEDVMYCLHCHGDPYFVQAINPVIACEHRKIHMQGDDCCEYHITVI